MPLHADNGSGASGTAILEGGERGFTVTVAVKPADRRYHAHIHGERCDGYRHDFNKALETVVLTLVDLRDWRSRSVVGQPLSKYLRHGFSIDVHRYDPLYPVVGCGELGAH